MRPPPLLVLLLALVLGVSAAQGARDAVNKPLLGIAGQPASLPDSQQRGENALSSG